MANQLHIARSAGIMGAGIVAGGPYGCAVGRLTADGVSGLTSLAVGPSRRTAVDRRPFRARLDRPAAERDARPRLPVRRKIRQARRSEVGRARRRIPPILKAARKPLDQTERPIRRPQQQPSGIRRLRPAVKTRLNAAPFNPCKTKQVRDTLCRHRGPLSPVTKVVLAKQLLQSQDSDAPPTFEISGLAARRRPRTSLRRGCASGRGSRDRART